MEKILLGYDKYLKELKSISNLFKTTYLAKQSKSCGVASGLTRIMMCAFLTEVERPESHYMQKNLYTKKLVYKKVTLFHQRMHS